DEQLEAAQAILPEASTKTSPEERPEAARSVPWRTTPALPFFATVHPGPCWPPPCPPVPCPPAPPAPPPPLPTVDEPPVPPAPGPVAPSCPQPPAKKATNEAATRRPGREEDMAGTLGRPRSDVMRSVGAARLDGK